MIGPGKYDDLCTYVREQAKAEAAIVIILNGEKGNGFSCQIDAKHRELPVLLNVPEILRQTLAQMEADFQGKP